jgi:hypothetical protein
MPILWHTFGLSDPLEHHPLNLGWQMARDTLIGMIDESNLTINICLWAIAIFGKNSDRYC